MIQITFLAVLSVGAGVGAGLLALDAGLISKGSASITAQIASSVAWLLSYGVFVLVKKKAW